MLGLVFRSRRALRSAGGILSLGGFDFSSMDLILHLYSEACGSESLDAASSAAHERSRLVTGLDRAKFSPLFRIEDSASDKL